MGTDEDGAGRGQGPSGRVGGRESGPLQLAESRHFCLDECVASRGRIPDAPLAPVRTTLCPSAGRCREGQSQG